jgi:Abnormal spindle-like microcephaly-assoc'd, ASPM-SPD-2-Hydin
LIQSLLIATGIALLAGCGGVYPRGSNRNSTLAASPSKLSFGKVQKGKSSNLSETLTNSGGAVVTISAANISGAGFSVSVPSLPTTLSPSQSVTVALTFSPTSATSARGTLAIVSDADNATLDIALSGTGMAQGQLSVSPASLKFGNVVVGTTASLNGTLGASGSSVTVSDASISSTEFALSGISLPTTLGVGQTTSFTVAFKPSIAGTASATLSFASDAGNSATVQALTGNGRTASEHSVDLSWRASAGFGVVGYNVYRGSLSGGPYSQINSVLEARTAYTDSAVTSGQTYYYVTTSVDGSGGESGYSNQAQAVIPNP